MMPRVCIFHEVTGKERYNTDRPAIPFRLMKNAGDWCEVEQGTKTLAGNVAGLCSTYGKELGRKFKFEDMKNGVFRITVIAARAKRTRKRDSRKKLKPSNGLP